MQYDEKGRNDDVRHYAYDQVAYRDLRSGMDNRMAMDLPRATDLVH